MALATLYQTLTALVTNFIILLPTFLSHHIRQGGAIHDGKGFNDDMGHNACSVI